MSETLGKIEKPDSELFSGKRKLYLIPLIFSGKDAPSEYLEKFKRYWTQVGEHIVNLECKAGKTSHIYHEAVSVAGEDGFKVLEELNPASYQIARDKGRIGAALEATEDPDLVDESMDWERCLLMGFMSQKAAKIVSDFYLEAYKKRYEYIAKRIDETLKPGESGMLFVQEGHRVQFPTDVEVFSVSPPALDEIRRWQRDRSLEANKANS